MKVRNLFILWSLFNFVFLSACKKDADSANPVLPTVTFQVNQPIDNQIYNVGDTIKINATITSSADLHGWGLAITRKGDDSLCYSWVNHYHTSSYSIDQRWVNTLNQDTTLMLSVDAAINHSGDVVSKKIQLKIRKL